MKEKEIKDVLVKYLTQKSSAIAEVFVDDLPAMIKDFETLLSSPLGADVEERAQIALKELDEFIYELPIDHLGTGSGESEKQSIAQMDKSLTLLKSKIRSLIEGSRDSSGIGDKTGWVSVEEDLPKDGEYVQVANNGCRRAALHTYSKKEEKWHAYNTPNKIDFITHWLKSPPAPLIIQ